VEAARNEAASDPRGGLLRAVGRSVKADEFRANACSQQYAREAKPERVTQNRVPRLVKSHRPILKRMIQQPSRVQAWLIGIDRFAVAAEYAAIHAVVAHRQVSSFHPIRPETSE
jgi:hypothetical protein